MNQMQRKYLVERIEGLARQKEQAIKVKYTIPEKRISFEEKLKLIIDKKVKLRPVKELGELREYSYFACAFDFSQYCHDARIDPKADDLIKKITLEKAKTLDSAMFMTENEALEAIKNFEAALSKIN